MKKFKKVATSFVAVLSVFATFAFTACEDPNNGGGGNGGGGNGGGGNGGGNTPTYTTINAVLENLKDFNPASATFDLDMEILEKYVDISGSVDEEIIRTSEGVWRPEASGKVNFADGDMDIVATNLVSEDGQAGYYYDVAVRDYNIFIADDFNYQVGKDVSNENFFYYGHLFGGDYFKDIMGETLEEFLPGDMTQDDILPLGLGWESYSILKLAKDYQAVTQKENTFTVDVNKLVYNLTSSTITILDSISYNTTINTLLQEPTIKNLIDAVNYDLTIEQFNAIFEIFVRARFDSDQAEAMLEEVEEYLPENNNATLYEWALELAASEDLAEKLGYEGSLGEQSVLQMLNDFDIDFNENWPEIKAELQKNITATEANFVYEDYEEEGYVSKRYDGGDSVVFEFVADEKGKILSQNVSGNFIRSMYSRSQYEDLSINEYNQTFDGELTLSINYRDEKQVMADLSERQVEEYLGWEIVENGTTDKSWGYVYDNYDEEGWNRAFGYYELTMVNGAVSNVKIYEEDGTTEISSNFNAETGLLTYTYNGDEMKLSVTKAEGVTYAVIGCDYYFAFVIEIGRNKYEYTSFPDYFESLNS